MLTINKYASIFLSEFYLDAFGNIRRLTDGYYGRFKKDDIANSFPGEGGYMHIQIPKVRTVVKRSHLALLLSGVSIPNNMEVDHIDGDNKNDHPSNLRIVNRSINSKNRKKRSDNTSGVTGISWCESKHKFVIRRTVGGVRKSTSRTTMAEAIVALDEFTRLDQEYTKRHGL